jgi:hypothetical protein
MTFTLAGFGYSCALVLAFVLLVSGAAKLAWRRETRDNFAAIGLPRPDLVAAVLPFVELGLALLLFAFPPIGGVLSLVVLAAFTATLARLLRRGVDAPCGCVGSPRRAAPLSWRSLLRNGALALLAVAALFAEPTWPSAPEIAATALLVAAGWVGLNLLKPRSRQLTP